MQYLYMTGHFEVNKDLNKMGWHPVLLNIALKYELRQLPVHVDLSVIYKSSQIVGYEDYINIVGKIHADSIKLERYIKTNRLTVNTTRTKNKTQSRGGLSYCQTQIQQRRYTFPYYPLRFFIEIILLTALWRRGRLSLNRNKCQEYFLGE